MPSWRAIVWASVASGLALAPGSATASVLVVGDSLAVGTEAPLRAALGGMAIEADVQNGRFSSEGVAILRERLVPEHDTVVFDLGTNDGPRGVATTARSLAAARDLVAGRCLVVATLNHPPVGGVSIDEQNAMIRQFASATPNVALVDWHAAAGPEGLLRPDGVHATSSGYALRGALFADAIAGCSSVGGGPASGPAPTGRGASRTKRPAAIRRRPRPPRPSLEARAADAVAARLSAAFPSALVAKAGDIVSTSTESLHAVLTPRGPEPVLGAPEPSL